MTAAIDSQEVPKQPLPSYYSTEDRTERCFVCGMPRYALLHRVTHFEFPFEFYRCECGTIKQVPLPNEAFFEWFFNSEIFFSSKTKSNNEIWGYYDYFADEECRMATSARRYKKLSKFFDRPMKMMKIGPSTGTFLHIAQKHGHHAIGCDISNRFADYARRTYGATIDVGRFEQMPYADGQFDVVLLFNVIENVPNLSDFLIAIRRTLKPGGYFIFNYVEMERNVVERLQRDKYFMYRPPICYAFSKKALSRMLEAFQFQPIATLLDIRHMHLEKVSTLLRWHKVLGLSQQLRVSRIPFPIYAYPSRIVVSRRW